MSCCPLVTLVFRVTEPPSFPETDSDATQQHTENTNKPLLYFYKVMRSSKAEMFSLNEKVYTKDKADTILDL